MEMDLDDDDLDLYRRSLAQIPYSSSSSSLDRVNQPQERPRLPLKVGDEVCRIVNQEMMIGTLEHLIKDKFGSTGQGQGQSAAPPPIQSHENRVWKVRWIHDPVLLVGVEAKEYEVSMEKILVF